MINGQALMSFKSRLCDTVSNRTDIIKHQQNDVAAVYRGEVSLTQKRIRSTISTRHLPV